MFHTHNGWHWGRTEDGGVEVVIKSADGGVMATQKLAASEWASVVAHVSAGGMVNREEAEYLHVLMGTEAPANETPAAPTPDGDGDEEDEA